VGVAAGIPTQSQYFFPPRSLHSCPKALLLPPGLLEVSSHLLQFVEFSPFDKLPFSQKPARDGRFGDALRLLPTSFAASQVKLTSRLSCHAQGYCRGGLDYWPLWTAENVKLPLIPLRELLLILLTLRVLRLRRLAPMTTTTMHTMHLLQVSDR